MSSRRAEADEFLAAHWSAMLQVAAIALGDRDRAVYAVTQVGADVRRRWAALADEGRPTAYLRRRLVEEVRHTARTKPLAVSNPATREVGALAPAFDALPLDDRLATGFDWTGHLPIESAEALGMAPHEVVKQLVLVHESLRDAVPPELDPLTVEPQPTAHRSFEEEYRHLLETRAQLAEGADQSSTLDAAGRRTRTRRLVTTGAVVALVAAGVGGAVVLDTRTSDHQSKTARPTLAVPATDRAWGLIQTWPARGALGRDPKVQVAVDRALPGRKNRILYADQESGQYEVVVRSEAGDTSDTHPDVSVKLLTSQRDLDSLTPWSDSADTNDSVAILRPSRDSGLSVLVLTSPGLRSAELAERLAIDRNGRITRTWRPITLVNGIARVPLVGQPDYTAARLRLGGFVRAIMSWSPVLSPGRLTPDPEPCADALTCSDAQSQRAFAERVAMLTGVPASAVMVTTRTTPIDASLAPDFIGGTNRRLAVRQTTALLPSGAAVQETQIRYVSSDGMGTISVSFRAVPTGESVHRPVLLAAQGSGQGSAALTPGAATYQFVDEGGNPLGRRLAADGEVARIPYIINPGSTGGLVTWDAKGQQLGSWRFSDLQANDPLDGSVTSDF
jgi:hypothetical protein